VPIITDRRLPITPHKHVVISIPEASDCDK
jgi:hypothetical protein